VKVVGFPPDLLNSWMKDVSTAIAALILRKFVFASGDVHRVIGTGYRRGDGAAFGALSVENELCSRPRPLVRVPSVLPTHARRNCP
jgi:hypothetical protein